MFWKFKGDCSKSLSVLRIGIFFLKRLRFVTVAIQFGHLKVEQVDAEAGEVELVRVRPARRGPQLGAAEHEAVVRVVDRQN